MDRHDAAVALGILMVTGGVGAYDWRLALILGGLVLVLFGVGMAYSRGD